MKKAFDQTFRDIKREVNKKVLKVPGIEQKVLDSTSNEPWGPHGSLLADIAQATRNYHEYQIIMTVIWKRINDTGKNWRHVYKALTVLEYLVAHGSERVIDDIREHAYQISTLSDFQYIDSSGKDQGSNVRKKSQSLVVLVNDKERIQEVRQKAAANRDKFRTTSMGGMYKPTGGYGDRYDDDRYGSRDDDRNGYGREREWGNKDDDRSGRYGDPYGRDGGRYGKDSDERYGRDGYRDDDYRGRSRSIDDYQYSSRSRSSDRERDRSYEEDGQYSARGSGARADDYSQDGSYSGKRLERKFSEQNLGAPPSYEEALGEVRSPVHSERNGETSATSAPKSSASVSTSPSQAIPASGTSAAPAPAPVPTSPPAPAPPPAAAAAPVPANKEVDGFDEFDPRGAFSAAPTTSNGAEMDFLGSLSESFSSNQLAIMPVTTATTASEANSSAPSASIVTNQPFEDPFGDGPFKALVASTDSSPAQPQNITPTSSFYPSTNQSSEVPQPAVQKVDTPNFGDTFPGMTYAPPSINHNAQLPSTNVHFSPQEFTTSNQNTDQNTDILADILPPSGPSHPLNSQAGFAAHSGFPAQTGQPGALTGFPGQISSALQTGFQPQSVQPAQPNANFYGNFLQQPGSTAPASPHMASQTNAGPASQYNTSNFYPQTSPLAPVASQMAHQTLAMPATHHGDVLGNFLPQGQTMNSQPALTPSTGSLALVPQPAKEKFEPKSAVWADTLSRGLVNFNISGPKTNPLADIGIDFDAINRKEKRMEKPTTAAVTSTINMGKAMGSGTGMGRAGASALRPPSNPMVGSGMGMGMGGAPGAGMGMGGYGGMNQPMGMNMGVGMNMGQGVQMQPTGFPPGSTMPAGYNPMMGRGGYAPQQPYGGGYR